MRSFTLTTNGSLVKYEQEVIQQSASNFDISWWQLNPGENFRHLAFISPFVSFIQHMTWVQKKPQNILKYGIIHHNTYDFSFHNTLV